MNYLLDTNIVSKIIKQDLKMMDKLDTIKLTDKKIFINGITYFEVKRGLLAVNATRKLQDFEIFCREYEVILDLDFPILDQASAIYADLKQRGLIIQTEDILIAATAIIKGLILVSNDSDLARINHLNLESW